MVLVDLHRLDRFADRAFGKFVAVALLGATISLVPPAAAETAKCSASNKGQSGTVCNQGKKTETKSEAAGNSATRASDDPLDLLKVENDRLSERLKRICRGC